MTSEREEVVVGTNGAIKDGRKVSSNPLERSAHDADSFRRKKGWWWFR